MGVIEEMARAETEELVNDCQVECELEIDELREENAKLRELVCEVWCSCPVDEDDCKKCPHYIVKGDEVWCDIPIRMRELGIEVSHERQ